MMSFVLTIVVVAAMVAAVAAGESGVVRLTDGTYQDLVTNGGKPWLIDFAKSEKRIGDLNTLAAALDGSGIQVGFVDLTSEKKIGAGNVGLRLIGPNKLAKTVAPSTGTLDLHDVVEKTLKEIQSRIVGKLPKKPQPKKEKPKKRKTGGQVLELTDSNFDDIVGKSDDAFMVAYIAPWCGHCQRLKPEWEQAARELEGTGVVIAQVDATANEQLARRFQVQGFPTIKFFPPGSSNKSDRDVIDYQMQREAAAIVQWSLQEFEKRGGKVTIEIPEVASQDVFDETCKEAGKCVLVVLPNLLDSGKAGREALIEEIKEAQREARHINFAWMEAGAQPEWESVYSLGFGFPAVLLLREHDSKQLGMIMKGAGFNSKSLSAFVSSPKGLGEFMENGWPEIKTTTPWAGEEPEIIEDEDDFDLDEFLNED